MIHILDNKVTITLETQGEIDLFTALIGACDTDIASAYNIRISDLLGIYDALLNNASPNRKKIYEIILSGPKYEI